MKKRLGLALLIANLCADPVQESADMPKDPVMDQPPADVQKEPAAPPVQPAAAMDDSQNMQDDPAMDQIVYVECDECDPYGSFILNEFKMGYFRFGDENFRHIYDRGVLDLQLTSSFRVWRPLYVYGAIEYIEAEGRSIGGHEKTRIRIVPLSLGLQYIQPITCDFRYYLTIGPRYFFFHQRNHSSSVPHNVNKSGCGGFINTGFIYYLSHHIIVDFFGEYSYKRMHFESHRRNVSGNSAQVGGLTLGAGIGYFW